ncbi:MAG: hypothetical protein FWH11_01700 [Micrococcales bacterium]|nr:hypothetical protein [Micrococcales bacterium]
MNSRLAPAHRLVVPGTLLLAVSFALVGCTQSADAAAKTGPISARFDALYSGSDDQWRDDNDKVQEIIAACMKEKGFEYIPEPADLYQSTETISAEDWDPVAHAKEYGYFITYGMVGYGTDESEDLPEPFIDDSSVWVDENDPNGPYYLSLSESERTAYDEALYGSLSDEEWEAAWEGDGEGPDWTTQGCSGEAWHERELAWEAEREAEESIDSTVMDDYDTYTDDKVANDRRVVKAKKTWSSCMTDAGYDFAEQEEAETSIRLRFDSILGIDSSKGYSLDLDEISSSALADLRALQEDEIATATADAQCFVKSGLRTAYDDAQLDAETEFYNSHKAAVDAYFEALAAAQKKS